ncbi:MAG: transposase [Armatimonadetes bacterium]|nr:transposase [Armatimonadota bacterium]
MVEAREGPATSFEKWDHTRKVIWLAGEKRRRDARLLSLPLKDQNCMKPADMRDRLNEEIRPRTYAVRVLGDEAGCLRLVRAIAAEVDQEWLDGARYLDMEKLKEQEEEASDEAGEMSEAAA